VVKGGDLATLLEGMEAAGKIGLRSLIGHMRTHEHHLQLRLRPVVRADSTNNDPAIAGSLGYVQGEGSLGLRRRLVAGAVRLLLRRKELLR
jgi:hypothetical protein